MSKKTIKEIHELFLQNIKEENEKERRELPSFEFNLNLKKKFISVGKETLNSNKMKIYNLKANYTIDKGKINKTFVKKNKNKNKNKTNLKINHNYNILSDKEYLTLMINDLKLICSSRKKKQIKFNNSTYNYNNNNRTMMPTFKNLKNENKFRQYNTFRGTRNTNTLFNNRNNMRTFNYKPVNLLEQIIGDENCCHENYYNLTRNNEERKQSFRDNIK